MSGGPIVALALEADLPRASFWSILNAGAADVVFWLPPERGAAAVAARLERWHAIEELAAGPVVGDRLVGESDVWRQVLRQIVEVARFTDSSVLITGETGTGKELVAHLIHDLDARADKGELVIVDCGSVVPTLAGSEFFGHERGAFTGATSSRDGAFALADGGTLFLDEVGELPLGLQAQLLRVVQEGAYKRVGSNTWKRTNFRLVCATNRDLLEDDTDGRFRRDFYYRIAGWVCRLPSLHERIDDIPALAAHFLRQLRGGEEPPQLDELMRDFLTSRDYPGNVRDLRHLVARLHVRHTGPGPITVGSLPDDELPQVAEARDWREGQIVDAVRCAVAQGATLREIAQAATDAAVEIAVAEAGGSLQRASQRLGVTARALQLRRSAGRSGDGRSN